MFGLIKLLRTFIGGKTELGIIVSLLALLVYALGWVSWMDEADELIAILKIVGALTGVALLSRIEDKKGFLKALKSLFGSWRK